MPPAKNAAGSEQTPDQMRERAFEWLMRLQDARADAGLRSSFETWLAGNEAHRDAYRSVERVWRLSGSLPADFAERIEPFPVRPETKRRRSVGRRAGLAGFAVAACLALLFLPGIGMYLEADYVTGTGELRSVPLGDGSLVHLDAESAVALRFGPAVREVRLLAGQAFFEVAPNPDRPFVVAAEDVRATVIGTSFAVGLRAAGVSVAVKSGAVQVADIRSANQVAGLAPSETLNVERMTGRFARSTVATGDIGAWRARQLVVHGATLAEVVEELDRHYRGKILVRDEALAERRITGIFDLTRPLEALNVIMRTQPGRITTVTPYLVLVRAAEGASR